jgi:DNA-binding MarR family transcriptional regulator
MKRRARPRRFPPASPAAFRSLAHFRYRLRRFLRFSEKAARSAGITPQQHQLLLGIRGFTGRGWATVSELAEFMQKRHNAVVGLVQRAQRAGLVRKSHLKQDRRSVRIDLTSRGAALLRKLTRLHLAQFRNPPRLDFVEAEGRVPSPKPDGQRSK